MRCNLSNILASSAQTTSLLLSVDPLGSQNIYLDFSIEISVSRGDVQPSHLALSFPSSVIPMKVEMAYKILERGRVRFSVQAESISTAVTYKFFANNKELANCEVKIRKGISFAQR